MAQHRSTLDGLNCAEPDCDHTAHDGLHLHPTCHPRSGMWIEYRAKTGVLRITCHECGELVDEIAVAP